MKKSLIKQNNIIESYFRATFIAALISVACVVAFYFFILPSSFENLLNSKGFLMIFSDFVEIMNVSIEESPYIIEGASYPPLAIIMLYPFALICKNVFAKYAGQTLTVNELTSKLISSIEFWIAISLFFVICSFFVIFLISKKYNIRGKKLFKTSAIILSSAPFLFAAARGNSIFISLIFIMAFLLLKDSRSPLLRETSYIFLAISGCLKIYPLFFGVFLLKDKKILESIRVAVYFSLIFFGSFFFFEGNLSDLFEFTDNLGGFMTNESRLIGGNNLSISALLFKVMYLFDPNITTNNTTFTVLNILIISLIFLISTLSAIVTKNDFSRLIICSAIVILVPSISYFYVLIFTFLPFLEFILNNDTLISNKKQKTYLYFFMFLYLSVLALPIFFIPHSLIIIFMLTNEVVSVFKKEIFCKGIENHLNYENT